MRGLEEWSRPPPSRYLKLVIFQGCSRTTALRAATPQKHPHPSVDHILGTPLSYFRRAPCVSSACLHREEQAAPQKKLLAAASRRCASVNRSAAPLRKP